MPIYTYKSMPGNAGIQMVRNGFLRSGGIWSPGIVKYVYFERYGEI